MCCCLFSIEEELLLNIFFFSLCITDSSFLFTEQSVECITCLKVLSTFHILSSNQLITNKILLMLKNTVTCNRQWENTCYSTGRIWKLVRFYIVISAHKCKCNHLCNAYLHVLSATIAKAMVYQKDCCINQFVSDFRIVRSQSLGLHL